MLTIRELCPRSMVRRRTEVYTPSPGSDARGGRVPHGTQRSTATEEAPVRPLVITQNMTVDGSIEMLDDWFDPQGSPPDQQQLLQRDSAACDALLLGRRTFEDFRGFWPVQEDDATGITDELNTLQKYVVTATMTDPAWQHSTLLSGDPVAAVRGLKEQAGAEISLTGSITLCHPLIEAGLVDEYRIWTHPYVQGRGRRLFPNGFQERLELREHHAFSSGVTYTRWARRKG